MTHFQIDFTDQEDSYKQIRSIESSISNDRNNALIENIRFSFYFSLFLLLTQPIQALPIGSFSVSNDAHRHLSIPFHHFVPNYSRNIPSQTTINPFRRERHRRLMIERLFRQFDDDGNGEFSKDEFYSFALRLNIYPRFHRFLKQQTTPSP